MDWFKNYCLSLLLLTSSIGADPTNGSSVEQHRVPRVSGRIVKVYSGNRPEPFMCSSEGYKSDPRNCASFYRCVKERNGKFSVFRYQCAPGTVYDPDLETCNHPKSTRRTECGGTIKPTESIDFTLVNQIDSQNKLPNPTNTNEISFIKESTTTQSSLFPWIASESISTVNPVKTTLLQTPSSLVPYTDTTTYDSGYNNYVMSTNQPWISNKQEYETKTTSFPKSTTVPKNDDICSNDGFTGDIENCRKFYRCVGNQRGGFLKYEFFCSESTVWDEAIQSCNHPWAVKKSKCGESMGFIDKLEIAAGTGKVEKSTSQKLRSNSAEYGQKTKETIQQQLQISHGSKVTQTQTQISHSDHVKQNQTQISYGDRITESKNLNNKQHQTQIAHGSAVSQTQTQIDYGDKGMQTQLQIDHSKDSSQSQTQIHESTTSQTTTSKQDNNQGNTNQCSESGFIGDSNDCKKFYRCVDSGRGTFTKYEYLCGEGTVWDQSIEACNHAWAVKECGSQSHSQTQSSTVKSTTYYVNTTATQGYSEAPQPNAVDNDVSNGNQGQTETTTFISTTSSKTTTSKEPYHETTNVPNNNNECKTSGFMGDSTSCKKFYRCVDDGSGGYTQHEFTCGEGTVWDPSIEACNHAWAVEKCGGSGGNSENSQMPEQTTVETSSETTIASTTIHVDKNTNEPIPTTVSSSTSTLTSTESNENNKCRNSGFMGDNKNCKKFYRCVDNGDGTYTRYEFACGEGTVWDSKIEACNHEWAVESCGGSGESSTLTYSSTSQQPILLDETNENEPTTTPRYESTSTTQSSSTTVTVDNDISTTDQACTGNGFIGDKNDCKKFYRCVEDGNGGYDRYEFSCGEGTVWDESISACNHAWAVKECGANGSGANQSVHESTSESTISSTETENKETSHYTTEKSTSTTGNPSENEIYDKDCQNEGFFGSMSDCKKFIRCVDDGNGGFTKYEFTCGEGTTWNQHIQSCDHPSPERPCGQDYHQTTIKESHINDEMIEETTTKMTSTASYSDKEESEATQKPQSSSNTCETEGFYGDPSDCKKFYRCVDDGNRGYTKYDFSCGDGTVWNQEILACDHESDDNSCLSSGVKPSEASTSQSQNPTTGSQSESTSTSSISTTGQETDKTDLPASTSNDKCTSDGFFAHPHDCKKFVRCVSNGDGEYTRYEFSCGEGTVWVQEIQACDHDNGDKSCNKQTQSTTETQEQGSSSTTESAYSSSTENQTQNKEDDEYPATQRPTNTNSNECTSEGYFANKDDCRKFYRCVDNGDGGYTKYDFVCGEGTAWDSNIGNCNHINEVASCAENNKEESHTQQTMKEEEVSQTTEGMSSTTQSTSSSSQQTEKTESGADNESNDKCKSEGYYGDSKDCRKFYRCVDDGKGGLTKYDFICGEGTIWDQDITNCNHPQDVTNKSCKSSQGGTEGENQPSATSSTTSSPQSTTSSSSSGTSTQSSSNGTQEESTKNPASNKDISCEEAGYYPNPNDCKKFYRCVDWDGDGKRFSVYHFECGEGTIWDPALDTCNHEESVYPPRDCSQTQSQTESSSEETTTEKQEETTVKEPATSEQTTTEQEETTTQQSTTSEKTTTQQSTTSEQTTTQQSTSEQTTTQQSTTSEQTTTQQSTTSEQTTTQQSTTSEQTTTQQSTTSEQTTTQQSTTSEQTTTQQPTTSEQTTTQQSTTEKTTTQESTTSEGTTTQESTTTTEQTTPQESTTSEQTTEESSTTEQITQESTTSEQTTEQTTTEETTDKSSEQTESSTSEGTTESSTTEAENSSTTEQSSTTESEQETTTQSSSSEKECPETEDGQYLFVCPTSFKRHPKYCNMFYQCTEDDDTHEVKIATFKCPNNTIYDESQTQCVEEDKAEKKCHGEMARKHRFKRLNRDSKEPITVDKEKMSCPSAGYHTFEKNIECSSGFLKCEKNKSGKITGYVYQCPEGYLFWAISKRCELSVNIRGCNQSSNDWKGRWNIPVDRKNVAS